MSGTGRHKRLQARARRRRKVAQAIALTTKRIYAHISLGPDGLRVEWP